MPGSAGRASAAGRSACAASGSTRAQERAASRRRKLRSDARCYGPADRPEPGTPPPSGSGAFGAYAPGWSSPCPANPLALSRGPEVATLRPARSFAGGFACSCQVCPPKHRRAQERAGALAGPNEKEERKKGLRRRCAPPLSRLRLRWQCHPCPLCVGLNLTREGVKIFLLRSWAAAQGRWRIKAGVVNRHRLPILAGRWGFGRNLPPRPLPPSAPALRRHARRRSEDDSFIPEKSGGANFICLASIVAPVIILARATIAPA